MPRARKTLTGAPAANLTSAVGVPYGEGERRLEAQRRTPVPAGPPPVPGQGVGGPGPIQGGPGPAQPQMSLEAALAAASAMRPPTSLYAASERPMEPITSGLSVGMGPGPEAIRTGDRVARTLRLIADVTGEARFEALAEAAARQGR